MSPERVQVLVAYPFLPHYRRAVLLELDAHETIDITYASDVTGSDGIVSMNLRELKKHIVAKQFKLGRLRLQPRVLQLAVSGKFDVYVFLGDVSEITYWLAALIIRLRRKRVLFWTIGWHRPEKGLKKFVRLAFYRLANGLLLYGEIAKRIGIEIGYPEGRMSVIGNSMEPPTIERDRPEGLPERLSDVFWVGAVIRLTTVKRLDLLLDGVAMLRTNGKDVRVLFVGDGPERANLIAQAAHLDVPLTLVGGLYASSEIEAVYQVLDVTVVPSAIGLTALQSLRYGVPVISDNDMYGQMPEWESIVPEVTGEHFEAGEPGALAEAINSVLVRLRGNQQEVAAQCIAEYKRRWEPATHARQIERELTRSQHERREFYLPGLFSTSNGKKQ